LHKTLNASVPEFEEIEFLTDRISAKHRSWNMSRIRSEDTSPEMRVRSFLHRQGYRFRVHVKKLPGSPDILLPKHRTAIFVHGCFWHRHLGCKQGAYFPKDPKQGVAFWKEKFAKNVERDLKNREDLEKAGWTVFVVWECETKTDEQISNALINFLSRERTK